MPLAATVDRFEDKMAVVRLDDGQELVLPKNELPPGLAEGARLILQFTHTADDEARRADEARKLLSDLLQQGQ